MYDANKIIIGLAISAALLGFPIWYSYAVVPEDGDGDGKPDYQPQPVLPDGGDGCIESKEFMRSHHMRLLDEWREAVVRHGDREYTAKKDGKTWERSLSGTCMGCHTNRQQFCQECHSYLSVEPKCWDCHVEPEKVLEGAVAPPLPPPTTQGGRPGRPGRPTVDGRLPGKGRQGKGRK